MYISLVPTSLLKDVFNTACPNILSIVNSSLATGTIPTCFKHAVVQTLLKKPNLNPTLPSSYRPISKLPFLSKVLEKVIPPAAPRRCAAPLHFTSLSYFTVSPHVKCRRKGALLFIYFFAPETTIFLLTRRSAALPMCARGGTWRAS